MNICYLILIIYHYMLDKQMIKVVTMNMEKERVVHGIVPIVPISRNSAGIELYRHFKNNPNDIVLRDPIRNQTITNSDVIRNSSIVALNINHLNLQKDDVIGLCIDNGPEFLYILLACLYTGITVTLLNPRSTQYELSHNLNVSKPKVVFCSEEVSKIVNSVLHVERIIIVDSGDSNAYKNFSRDSNECDIERFRPTPIEIEEVALILYSSGSTGLPKGVCLTHANINSVIAFSRDPRYHQRFECKTTVLVQPLYYAGGLFMALSNFLNRVEVILFKTFNPDLFLEILQNRKIKIVQGVTTLGKFLAKSPLVEKYELRIDGFALGGTSLTSEIIQQLVTRFKPNFIWLSYGMTEMTTKVTSPTDNNKIGSCGQLHPYMSLKVVDVDTGNSLGPLQVGELCFKGPQIMKRYKGNEEATRQAIDKEGWLHSGDVGYYDKDGYLFVVDRIKELIKYKEFQVSPTELENVLLTHPKIIDAAVIGIPNEDAGELPLAFVVKRPNQTLSEEDVQKYVASQVSSYKRLRGGVIFLNKFPETSSSKTARQELKKILKHKL